MGDNIINDIYNNLLLYKYKLCDKNNQSHYIICNSNKDGIFFLFDNELLYNKDIENEINVYVINNYSNFDYIIAGFNQMTVFLIKDKCFNYYNLDLI